MLTENSKLPFELSEDAMTCVRTYIKVIYDYFNGEGVTIYLFGSLAKGGYFDHSDVDLLVILDNTLLTSERKRDLRIKINDLGCNSYFSENLTRELDCKIYGEIDFISSTLSNFFEKDICKDLVNVTDWR